jgi:wyosine [tRNA(Phe)-imidazoG37] synthetase (radical SAM superfamily)
MLDFISFSGSGEPTLHSKLGEIIKETKTIGTPVAVLTNSTLLKRADVRADLSAADLVIASLDAVSQEIFEKINRPCSFISSTDIIDGLRLFCDEYKGKVWLEVLLVKDVNDCPQEVQKIAEVANSLPIEKVHLNTICRDTTVKGIKPVPKDTLIQLGEMFYAPVEVYV